jgi:hypothetical protein
MQHNVIQTYQTAGGSITGTTVCTGDMEQNADVVLSAGASNVLLTYAFTRANAKSCVLYCSGDCTIKTNSSGSPQDTITLNPGIPIPAASLTAVEAIFSGNITAFYLSSTAGGTFSVRLLLQQ